MGLIPSSERPALREIVAREPQRDLAGLLAQLRDGDAAGRRWAARDLAGHPQAAASLGAALAGERDAGVREALFTTLSGHAGEAAAAALLPLLRSEDAGLRNGAIEALAAMPEAVAPRIEAMLHDADADLRIFAVNLLGELRHPGVPRWLEQVLAEDREVNVVAAAVEVLAEAGTAQQRPALQAAAQRFAHQPFVAFAVELALQRIGTP